MATTTFTSPNGNVTQDTGLAPNAGASAVGVITDGTTKTRIKNLTVWPYCTALGTATFGKVTFYDGTGSAASATSSAIGIPITVAMASAQASGTVWPAGPITLSPFNITYPLVSGLMAVWVTGNNCTSAVISYEWERA